MAQAATYLLSHPDDVAVFSMRELARHADVPPVTLVRLAQRLGLPGYGELRKTYVDVLLGKGRRTNLATKRNIESARSILAASKSKDGLGPFVQAFIDGEEEIIRRMAAGLTLPRIAKVVDLLATAPNVFVIGRRTTFPPAFILAYALRKARPQVRLLDDVSGAPEAGLDDVQAGDVVVAFTFAPFSRVTDTLVRRAAAARAHIVAISDSPAPPLRKFAGDLFFIAPTLSRAFANLPAARSRSQICLSPLPLQGWPNRHRSGFARMSVFWWSPANTWLREPAPAGDRSRRRNSDNASGKTGVRHMGASAT